MGESKRSTLKSQFGFFLGMYLLWALFVGLTQFGLAVVAGVGVIWLGGFALYAWRARK